MPNKGEFVKLKNYERKTKSSLITYAEFESILIPEENRKQNPEDYCTNKYQEHTACNYGYILLRVDDKFSKPYKTHLDKDTVYNNMIEESNIAVMW